MGTANLESGSAPVPAIERGLASEGSRLREEIIRAVREVRDLNAIIERSPSCTYIKASDGQVLATNTIYDQTFGNGIGAAGRYTQAYLDQTILPVSENSDALVICGCSFVEFRNAGRTSDGQAVQFHTVKYSLLGIGHPKLAILGLTDVVDVAADPSGFKVLSLARRWQLFEQLSERDRECAVLFALGERTKTIAERFSVTDKTIDNRRAAILKALRLKNTMELTRLLCRLQDNGFSDFGL